MFKMIEKELKFNTHANCWSAFKKCSRANVLKNRLSKSDFFLLVNQKKAVKNGFSIF